jgi:hypothetical protein
MTTTVAATEYTIHFSADLDERDEYEMPLRGYCSDVVVELSNGSRFPLYFYDPVRLKQTLESDVQNGHPYYAEPGLVVVPEVTLEYIRQAVAGLHKAGFFDTQKPLAALTINGQLP